MSLSNSKIPTEMRFCILACVYIAGWGMMQLFIVKLVPLDLSWIGLGVTSFVMSEFLFAVTFPITDVVTEVWGSKRARMVVYGGMLVYVIATVSLSIAVYVPSPDFWQPQSDSYALLYQAAPRMLLASIVAMSVSQLLDIYVFNGIRNLTGSRMLWLRNNLSTLVSQSVDVVIFYFIAFYGLMPNEALIGLMIGNYLLKITLAVIDTPFVYLLVRWARSS